MDAATSNTPKPLSEHLSHVIQMANDGEWGRFDLNKEDQDALKALLKAYEDLRFAVILASNSCGDVVSLGRFAPSVDPIRWVADIKTFLDEEINKL